MAPSHPTSTIHLLASLLLLTSAFALPRQPYARDVLGARAPISDTEDVAIILNDEKEGKNFFKELGQFLSDFDPVDVFRAILGGLMGFREDPDGEETTAVATPTKSVDVPARSSGPSTTVHTVRTTVTRLVPMSTLAASSLPTVEEGFLSILPFFPPEGEPSLTDGTPHSIVVSPTPVLEETVDTAVPTGVEGEDGVTYVLPIFTPVHPTLQNFTWPEPTAVEISASVGVSATLVIEDSPTTTATEESEVSVTLIQTPDISILPHIEPDEGLSANVTWPIPTNVEISIPELPVPVITPATESGNPSGIEDDTIATPKPTDVHVPLQTGGLIPLLEFVNGTYVLPTTNVHFATPILNPPHWGDDIATNPAKPTPKPRENANKSSKVKETSTRAPIVLPPPVIRPTGFPVSATFVPFFTSMKAVQSSAVKSTRPLILTNPLRPSIETFGPGDATKALKRTTKTIKTKSTTYVTLLVFPTPADEVPEVSIMGVDVPADEPLPSDAGFVGSELFPNGDREEGEAAVTTVPVPALPALPPSFPLPAPQINTSLPFPPPSSRLPEICADPKIQTITLPLLAQWFGPAAYPSLTPYPGCAPPNARQALQAPGLLNCTALGRDVQTCQRAGRRVLLGIKVDAPAAVNGNLEWGTDIPQGMNIPLGRFLGRPRPPLGDFAGNLSTVVLAGKAVPAPNLFDGMRKPAYLAATLFSLFAEGHAERADLRPLGPDASPGKIAWVAKPLGEEVVVDGFDVRTPRQWKGTKQGELVEQFVGQLRELVAGAWREGGGKRGAVGDLGVDGPGIVVSGYI